MKTICAAAIPAMMILAVPFNGMAENPWNFRTEENTVALEFKTPEDAAKAELEMLALPYGKKIAVMCRWDDTNPRGHSRTLEVMKKNGMKGTFFYSGTNKESADFARKAAEAGSSIGVHQMRHPYLGSETPNRQFWEYMRCKIGIESDCGVMAVSQVTAFARCNSCSKYTEYDVGKIIKACGITASPEFGNFTFAKALGLNEKELAESKLLAPGDKEPNVERFEKSFASAAADAEALKKHPAITIGVHSWHSDAGLVKLDEVFKRVAGNPDFWYCNQNEYGAYRANYNFHSVTKKVEGNTAVFTVKSMRPEDLGAYVPLFFAVRGAEPVTKYENGMIEVKSAHTAMPVVDIADKDGKSTKFNGISFTLSRTDDNFVCTLENGSGKTLTDVSFVFYLPPQYGTGRTLCGGVSEVGAGNPAKAEISAVQTDKSYRFKFSRTYVAASADFMMDGRPCRIYADMFIDPENEPLRISDVSMAYYPVPENIDASALSKTGEALGFTRIDSEKRQDLATGYVPTLKNAWNTYNEKKKYITVAEFTAVEPGKELEFRTNESGIWFNGEKVNVKGGKAKIVPKEGVNRILSTGILSNREVFIMLNAGDDEKPRVQFVKMPEK